MSTLVYMKMLEQNPNKYDRGMRILTLGRLDQLKNEIASKWIQPGQEVLEIGCGTGSLASLMSKRGAHVLGLDVSEPMLSVATQKAPQAEFAHATATEIDQLEEGRFDRVVATLSFSELSDDELESVISSTSQLLKSDGLLIVGDEIIPKHWWERIVFFAVRWPLAALTFLLTQNTTRALQAFDERLQRKGFRVLHYESFLMGTFALIVAEKASCGTG